MRASLLVLTLLLGTTAHAQKSAPWTPTMEADPAETGAEGFLLLNEMGKAYEIYEPVPAPAPRKFCDYTRESFQEHGKYAVARYKVSPNTGKQSARTDFQCFVYKKADANEVADYLRAGFALSNLYCKTFFRRTALHSNQRGYARSVVNDVGTAMSAILGLAKAGSIATGVAGTVFGAADTAFRGYDSQFMVSADMSGVQKLVFKAQEKFKETTYAKMPTTYFDAAMTIQTHANYCSFIGMKVLVNDAVEKDAATEKDAGG